MTNRTYFRLIGLIPIGAGAVIIAVIGLQSVKVQAAVEWGFLILIAGLLVAGLVMGCHLVASYREGLLLKRAQRKQAERDAEVTTVIAGQFEQVYIRDLNPLANWSTSHLPRGNDPLMIAAWSQFHTPREAYRLHKPDLPQLAAPQMARPMLLDAIVTLPNVLIVGGKGTGKTTLMQWLAMQRASRGNVLVFDSHDHPAKWPAGHVIGNGRNYQDIWRAMLALVSKLDNRYKDFAAGVKRTGEFGYIDNFIDELTLLPGYIKDLGGDIRAYNRPLLTEGRKVDLNVVWGVHSDRVEALGLKGAADLKECFDAVVYLKLVGNDRYALVDFGEGKGDIRYSLPGPFQMVNPAYDDLEPIITPAPEPEPDKPTDEEMAILTAFVDVRDNEPKFSYAEVCRRCNLKPGGEQYNRIRNTLRKWGVEPI